MGTTLTVTIQSAITRGEARPDDDHIAVLIVTAPLYAGFQPHGGRSMSDPDGVFTSDQVMRLTGVSRRKLDYWIRRGVITPEIDQAKGRGRVRLFSFPNLVELRVALWLRDVVSLQLIRKIVLKLREEGRKRPLAEVRVGLIEERDRGKRREVVIMPESGKWESWRTKQLVMEIMVPLKAFASELEDAAARDRARRRRVGRIEQRRGVLGSAPVLAGTRVPTRAIWSLHQAGYDDDRILENYPGLQRADVVAAIREERRRQRARSKSA